MNIIQYNIYIYICTYCNTVWMNRMTVDDLTVTSLISQGNHHQMALF